MVNRRKEEITSGKYRHYKKGDINVVIGVALHTEADYYVVVYYREDDPNKKLFARPIEMFKEEVLFKGERVKRYERISDAT